MECGLFSLRELHSPHAQASWVGSKGFTHFWLNLGGLRALLRSTSAPLPLLEVRRAS